MSYLIFICTSCSKAIDNPTKPTEEIIRIKLDKINKFACPITFNGAWTLWNENKSFSSNQGSTVIAEVYNKKIQIKYNGKVCQGKIFQFKPNPNTTFCLKSQESQNGWVDRWYTGDIIISLEYNKEYKTDILCVVNRVSMETYLQGVVPWEMKKEWEEAALKAQAVAARTYALYEKYSRKNKQNYDVVDTINSQVYKGLFLDSRYIEKINKVIQETRGQVLFYNNSILKMKTYYNSILKTYFSARCGGHTAFAKEVFGEKDIAPYVGVHCFCSQYHEQENQNWTVNLSNQKINELFTKLKLSNIGTQYNMVTEKSDYSDRIKSVHCQKYQNNTLIAEQIISGQDFRIFMGLKSAFFTLNWNAQEQVWQCQGHGNGHGVGLCQYGAQAMATKGYTYGTILLHYYPGASLYKLW